MTDISEKNAKEEIIEITEKCIKCGLCKELCPVFKILHEEQSSPRGQAILLNHKIIEELVYECSLCKACEEKCPVNVQLCSAIRKAREVINLKNREPERLKKMLKKIEDKENPYL